MELKEYDLDIQELKQLLEKAQRQSVRELLSNRIRHIQVELEQVEKQKKAQEDQKQQQQQQQQQQDRKVYQPISKYSYDQEGKKVSIYLNLDDINTLSKENINVTFKEQSLEVLIHDYKKQNYKFSIPQLCEKINASQSKFVVKKDYILITLVKENSGNWAQLQYKESTFKKPKENELDSGDPQASLMKLMKEMYENGDDEMKKTIAKTWTEQQNKKGQAL